VASYTLSHSPSAGAFRSSYSAQCSAGGRQYPWRLNGFYIHHEGTVPGSIWGQAWGSLFLIVLRPMLDNASHKPIPPTSKNRLLGER